jgi:hypothetical protein
MVPRTAPAEKGDVTTSGGLSPDESEIGGFIVAAMRITDSQEPHHEAPNNPFRLWFDGGLREAWQAARQSARKTTPWVRNYYGQPPSRNDSGRAGLVGLAGRDVIRQWALKAGLVGSDSGPLAWLVDRIDEDFKNPGTSTGFLSPDQSQNDPEPCGLSSPGELIILPQLPRRPKEGTETWIKRRIKAAKQEYMSGLAESKMVTPVIPSKKLKKCGTYMKQIPETVRAAVEKMDADVCVAPAKPQDGGGVVQ